MEAPLDISDEQLFSDSSQLQAAVAALDENGWSTSGNLTRTSWQRVWFEHCRIREDILEIALGSGQDDISEQAEQIRLKTARLHNKSDFPFLSPFVSFRLRRANPNHAGSLPHAHFLRVPPEEVFEESYRGGLSVSGKNEKAVKSINAVLTLCESHLCFKTLRTWVVEKIFELI